METRVRDLARLINERFNPLNLGNGLFQYIEIADVDQHACTVRGKAVTGHAAPGRARKKVQAGDILVSTVRPERKAIGVVPAGLDGAICSTGLAVLRCTTIAPLVLARVLQCEFVNAQIIRNSSGIAYPSIDEVCLLDLVLPVSASELAMLTPLAVDVQDARAGFENTEMHLCRALACVLKRSTLATT